LSALGDLAAASGDFAQAVRWQREALALVREVGIREDIPQLEVKLAHQLWLAGERDEARRMLKQSQESADEIGLPEVTVAVQYGYATLARFEGDLDSARETLARNAEQMTGQSWAPQFRATTRSTQGLVEAAAGNLSLARRMHREAMRIAVDTRDQPVVALVLVGIADLVLRQGDPERAAFLLGAADAVRGSQDRSVPDAERITFEARAALGDAGFAAAYGRAAGMTLAGAAQAAALDPPAEGPDRERGKDDQQDAGPDH